MKGFIYKYTYPNGKVYIGQTSKTVEERHAGHMYGSRHLDKAQICEFAIHKYGEPVLEILEEIEVPDNKPTELVNKLNEREKFYIDKYNSANRLYGYNIQNGGEHITRKEFILQEKWYEIYEEEHWSESIMYVYQILESIGNKMFYTNEKLSQEERMIFYGYKFIDDLTKKETTFNAIYKQRKDLPWMFDIGEYSNEELDNMTENDIEFEKYIKTINNAINNDWVKDIQQTIWRKVMKHKDKYINDFYKK